MGNKNEIDNYYFIDSENVPEYGMNGIEKLGKNDRVRIYYRANAPYLNIELHRKIYESPAGFEYERVELDIKNAIDVKIVEFVNDHIRTGSAKRYFIVSHDNDYDKQIAWFCSNGASVARIASVAETPAGNAANTQKNKNGEARKVSPKEKKGEEAPKVSAKEKKREDKVRTFFGQQLKDKKYKEKKEEIISAIITSKDRAELNNTLQKLYESKDVKLMMKTLKPLTNELYK